MEAGRMAAAAHSELVDETCLGEEYECWNG